jgi:hypothetical protein
MRLTRDGRTNPTVLVSVIQGPCRVQPLVGHPIAGVEYRP